MLPQRVHLPSGRVVRLAPGRSSLEGNPGLRRSIRAFDGSVVRVSDEHGAPLDVESLYLDDFHVLRAIVTHAGLLPEPAMEAPCYNCEEFSEVRPCEAFEPGPYVDGELHDPDLDEPFPFDRSHELEAVEGKHEVELRRVTVAEARALHEALDAGVLRVTGALVAAMGVVSFDGETHLPKVGRMLQQADDPTWEHLTDLFDSAYYGPRLHPWWRCLQCGARNEIEAPLLKEFQALPLARSAAEVEGFPSEDAFEDSVRRLADSVFERMGVRNVALTVETGVPECDAGGVPLLGSYDPGEPESSGVPAVSPEVRLYYRTFRSMYAEEPFDIESEIEETLEHELQHHLGYLAGHDPEDERELEQIADEQGRMVGKAESARRAARAVGGDFFEFLRRTWPLWVLVAAVTIAAALASR